MPHKRKPGERKPGEKRRQIAPSFTPSFAARIERAAEALGLDATDLLRMIVTEHLAQYEKRAAAVKRGENPDEE
jgi:hypothetical protein